MLLLSGGIPVHAVNKHVRLIYLPPLGNILSQTVVTKCWLNMSWKGFGSFHTFFTWLDTANTPSFVSPIHKRNYLPHPSQKALGSSQGPSDIVVKPSMENMGSIVHLALPVELSQLVFSCLARLVLRHCVFGAFDQTPNVSCLNYLYIVVYKKNRVPV